MPRWLFVGLAAVLLWAVGASSSSVANANSNRPELISMRAIEQGKRPSQQFVLIDDFYALHTETMYDSGKHEVRNAVFPIVSLQHPWCMKWDALVAKYGARDKVPKYERPKLERVRVVGYTDDYRQKIDIPKSDRRERGTIGMLFTFEQMSVERSLMEWLETNHPREVVSLRIGARPPTVTEGLAFKAVAWILALLAVLLFFGGRSRDERSAHIR